MKMEMPKRKDSTADRNTYEKKRTINTTIRQPTTVHTMKRWKFMF